MKLLKTSILKRKRLSKKRKKMVQTCSTDNLDNPDFIPFMELFRKIKQSGDTGKLSEPRIEWTQVMNPKFKGDELLIGDVIDFDGVLYKVTDPIAINSTEIGKMIRIAGICIPYPKLWQRILCKLGFLEPNYWRDIINIYCNTIYNVVGNGAENVN